jgi:hypothetical protein
MGAVSPFSKGRVPAPGPLGLLGLDKSSWIWRTADLCVVKRRPMKEWDNAWFLVEADRGRRG